MNSLLQLQLTSSIQLLLSKLDFSPQVNENYSKQPNSYILHAKLSCISFCSLTINMKQFSVFYQGPKFCNSVDNDEINSTSAASLKKY